MKNFVEYIVKNLVDEPDEVFVTCTSNGDNMLAVEVRVAKEDVGKVVGRGGKTIKALRLVAALAATRVGHRVQLSLIEEE